MWDYKKQYFIYLCLKKVQMTAFKNGVLKLDLSDKQQKKEAIFLAFNQMNEDYELYNSAYKLVPKIKGLGSKRKSRMVFDIIELVFNYNKKDK